MPMAMVTYGLLPQFLFVVVTAILHGIVVDVRSRGPVIHEAHGDAVRVGCGNVCVSFIKGMLLFTIIMLISTVWSSLKL
jgi:hypothetical protein